jgi:Flp pilus assembly protein TadD
MTARLHVPCLRIALIAVVLVPFFAHAKDLRITLPKRSKPTPVQKLNRDGVKAIEKHNYEEAKKLFYRAYLIDPNDPFTLNNLGYISELEGDLDRAQRFYDLASQMRSDAVVDISNDDSLKGKPVDKVAGGAADTGMQVNRINVEAINLLRKGRAPEADLLLQKGLEIDPKNPFTLNNLGYTKEKEGELESALGYYTRAAQLQSEQPVIVTINKDWRGKAISQIASDNAKKLRKEMRKEQTPAARLARLNLEGVSALNRNDRSAARRYFHQAYKLDPNDAFTLNNMGYLSELNGDRETADFFYEKAAEAGSNRARVDVSTRQDMEGLPVREVANISDDKVSARMEQEREARAREGGPIVLKQRDGQPARPEPSAAPAPATQPPPPR